MPTISNDPPPANPGRPELARRATYNACMDFVRAFAAIDSAEMRGEIGAAEAEQARETALAEWHADMARLRALYPLEGGTS